MPRIVKNKKYKTQDIQRILKQHNPQLRDLEIIYKIDFLKNYQQVKLGKNLLNCISWEVSNKNLFRKVAEYYFQKIKKNSIIDIPTKNLVHHHIMLKPQIKEKTIRKI